ncbi:MAG: pyridoxal-phosphate dependent enzyme [Verrucomicrobium sp.]|nr:pyridoxal-phosphate dependent enzyme [Verrucomicrobium sp.]
MIIEKIQDAIGRTPIMKLDPAKTGLKNIDLYAKLDLLNPFGSLKDRIAQGMLEPHMAELLAKKKTVIEGSSGNTAKSLAAICAVNGLDFRVYTNRIKLPEIRMILQLLGAQIEELPSLSDCPDPMDNNSFFAVADGVAKAEPEKYLYTDQIFNPLNLQSHYATTAKEIHEDIGEFHYYINFLGTCGSSMGVIKYAKENFKEKTACWGVVASPGHHVPGGRNMNELWETSFFDKDVFDEFIHGTARDSVEGIISLCRNFGILAGPTSGLQYHVGLKRLQEEDAKLEGTGVRKKAAFIICDRVEPYMTYIKKYYPELFTTATSTRPRVDALSAADVEAAPALEAEALSQFLGDGNPLVIDVRGNFAYNMGHLPGAVNILDELFGQMIEEGPISDKSRKILVACGIGNISRKYAAFLRTQGYDAYSLKGGINGCKKAGVTLASGMAKPETGGAHTVANQAREKGYVSLSGLKQRAESGV